MTMRTAALAADGDDFEACGIGEGAEFVESAVLSTDQDHHEEVAPGRFLGSAFAEGNDAAPGRAASAQR